MAIILAITNSKGGVGKTSLVAIIASIFANMGYRKGRSSGRQ